LFLFISCLLPLQTLAEKFENEKFNERVTMWETRRRQRRMEASAEGGRGPEGAVAPQMEWIVKMHVACMMTKMISESKGTCHPTKRSL
jgi:hypothetical protein